MRQRFQVPRLLQVPVSSLPKLHAPLLIFQLIPPVQVTTTPMCTLDSIECLFTWLAGSWLVDQAKSSYDCVFSPRMLWP